jgi:predicted deacylase
MTAAGFAGGIQHLESHTFARFHSAGRMYEMHRYVLHGPKAGHEPIRLGLFAGVHGDEPAGSLALLQFLEDLTAEPGPAVGYELWAYPWVSPTGAEDGTRENRAGKDLNREFWKGSEEPEVQAIEAELRAQRFQGLITLHADDTCEGHYGYAHGQVLDDALLRPALRAAERVLPRDRRSTIDGFSAREGVINHCFQGILSGPPDQRPRPFNLIFETPAHALLHDQVAAHAAALNAILAAYRGFIAYGQDL